ncbi:MAG: nucleoside recognition domain-containing protein, partial [Plesiomonas shigelloides]
AVPASIGTCVAVMFVMKIVGANLFRIYLKATEGKGDSESDTTKPAQTNA